MSKDDKQFPYRFPNKYMIIGNNYTYTLFVYFWLIMTSTLNTNVDNFQNTGFEDSTGQQSHVDLMLNYAGGKFVIIFVRTNRRYLRFIIKTWQVQPIQWRELVEYCACYNSINFNKCTSVCNFRTEHLKICFFGNCHCKMRILLL